MFALQFPGPVITLAWPGCQVGGLVKASDFLDPLAHITEYVLEYSAVEIRLSPSSTTKFAPA